MSHYPKRLRALSRSRDQSYQEDAGETFGPVLCGTHYEVLAIHPHPCAKGRGVSYACAR
jgi:hypothetical protein